jgi:hypothetical protein
MWVCSAAITIRAMRYLLVLLVLTILPSIGQTQGFSFIDIGDTVYLHTNSSQDVVIYARNDMSFPWYFYADQRSAGGTYGQIDVNDESFFEAIQPGQLVKTVITYTPFWDKWDIGAQGKIYLYDTSYNVTDSVFIICTRDSNRESAGALKADTLLDFGTVDLGQSHTAQVLFENTSGETLTIDTIMINGFMDMLPQYSIDQLPVLPLVLQPDQSKVIELTFTPDGTPAGGWLELIMNYHIGDIFQTTRVALDGRTGKFAAGSADTLDLGPIPAYAFVGKKVRLKNNLSDSVEVHDYDPFSYFDLVVVMDSEGDSMVLGPHEEKDVIIYGLGMGFPAHESKVQLEFTTHNGPLFHLGFVDVIVRTQDIDEDVTNPDRIFPLGAKSTVFIPYGTEIEDFDGTNINFGETLKFENIAPHNVAVTEIFLGDSLSTGYVLTNFDSTIGVLAPDDVFTVDMDRHDTTIAAGWLVIITDSTDLARTKAIELPPIIAPKLRVESNSEPIDLKITALSDRTFEINSTSVERSIITIVDITGREIARGTNGMRWNAPAVGQAYIISIEGRKNGRAVRAIEKLLVE